MAHDELRTIIRRYTPTMFDFVEPSSPEQILALEAAAGPLPEDYRDFLTWMGNRCPFLDAEQIAYSPEDLLELVYDDPEIEVPDRLLWIGVDKSGAGISLFLRPLDGAVVHIEYYDGMMEKDGVLDNATLASYLFSAYIRRTLAPSHPFHFAAALSGDDDQLREMARRVDETCAQFKIDYPAIFPDLRFYGGDDFIIALYKRPASSVMNFYFGALERIRHEVWYDLIFGRWRLLHMPM